MGAIAPQITTLTIVFTHPFIQAQIKENMKAPRHLPLGGEFTSDTIQKASNAENVSIWWRHHIVIHMRVASHALKMSHCEKLRAQPFELLTKQPMATSLQNPHMRFKLRKKTYKIIATSAMASAFGIVQG